MGDVVDLRPRDPLLALPECPVQACAKCGASPDEAGWIDLRVGCGRCTPELMQLSLAIGGLESRVMLLESALRIIYRKTLPAGNVRASEIERVLADHLLADLTAEETDG